MTIGSRPTFYGTFRESNARHVEIIEADTAEGVPIELDVYDGADPATMLATLEAARHKRWNPQLSDTGSGSFVINRHEPKATPHILAEGNLIKVRIGGRYRGAWWAEDVDWTEVAAGEKAAEDVKLAGRGEVAYIERGAMWTESYIGHDPVDLVWDLGAAGTGNALGDMLRRVLAEGLARPDGSPYPFLSLGWPYGADSQGATWDDQAELRADVGTDHLQIWRTLTALGLESEMTHQLQMRTYRELGRHFEPPPSGDGSVTLLRGKHVLGDHHARRRLAAKTRMIVRGANGVAVVVNRPDLEADPRIGRREGSVSFGSTDDPTTLQRGGEAALEALALEGVGLELPVAHGRGPGEYEPFIDYRVGDWIGLEEEDGTLAPHRVVGMIFEEIPGDYALTLQLNSVQVEALIRLKRMIDALGGGQAGGGTGSGSVVSGGTSSGGTIRTEDIGKVRATSGDAAGFLYDKLAEGLGIRKALIGGGTARQVELHAELALEQLQNVAGGPYADDDVAAFDAAAGLFVPRPRGAGGGGGGIAGIADLAPAAWFDADHAASIQLDGSNRVSQWSDRSGNGIHATQGTAGSRPHAATHNGRTWLDFSQGNHFLSTTGPPLWRAARTYISVIYLPYSSHAGRDRRVWLEAYAQYFQGTVEIGPAAGSALTAHAQDGGLRQITAPAAFPLQAVAVITFELAGGGGMQLWRNASGEGSDSLGSPGTASFTGFRIGTYRDTNGRWYDGYIGEIAMIDGRLSSRDRRTITNLLLAKWS